MKGSGGIDSEVVMPYAQALMSSAKSQNITEEIGTDVRDLLRLLQDSDQLQNFVANPFVKEQDKKRVLEQVIGDRVHPYLRNFLRILVDRRRIILLEGICQQYLNLLRQLNQTVLAEVTSTVELSRNQRQAIKDKVKAMTSAREVELDMKIDSELIAGAIVKVGSQVIDASLRGQLRRLSLSLTSGS
ncbi:ATP synthase F1 subunit delta [Synechocystis sp. PCC 7509]|uniref:ATP synthase F1 subunit delta n=1 Tax=Synechocystis sp. PCC 7509 TaxID=927677 RepID=UPI0002AC0F51|nr:ATP synthase F1 subunit delta [Synechocystis sp. PCC 7509]